MKSNLKMADHALIEDQQAIEVWYEGRLVAAVYGADGPGVRVISKYPYDVVRSGIDEILNVIEVRIEIEREPIGENLHER
jgi:hypothetical protein